MYKYVDDTATPEGEFTNGDPELGIARTVLHDHWPNMIQRELLNVVEGASLAPAPDQFDQVLKAIQSMISVQRIGRIEAGPYATVPAEALVLEGGLYNRANYPDAWDYIQAHYRVVSDSTWQNGNHGAFSSGDGSTTFRVPDLRDEFVRGRPNGRAVGSAQGDAMRNLTGNFRLRFAQFNAGNHSLIVSTGGAIEAANAADATRIDGGGSNTTQPTTKVSFDASKQVPTAGEFRPHNIAWRWIMWVK